MSQSINLNLLQEDENNIEAKDELSVEDLKTRLEEQINQTQLLKGMVLEKETSLEKQGAAHKVYVFPFQRFTLLCVVRQFPS